MKFLQQKESLSAIIIAILVVALLFVLKPATVFAPKGLILPTATQHMTLVTTPAAFIVAYIPGSLPLHYKNIGNISVMLHGATAKPTKAQEQKLVEKAKQLAANFGANAILIRNIEYAPPRLVGKRFSAYYLQGAALFVVGGRYGN